MSVIHYLLLHQWVCTSSKWAYVNIVERSPIQLIIVQ